MAKSGTEVARAYVTIIPKSDGTSDKVVRSVVDPFSKSGNDAGENAGRAFHAKFGSAIGAAGKAAGVALVAGMGAATVAVGAFAKSSVEAGRSFDASMSQVAATMGKSVDEIGELRDFAQEMGAKTAFSASESADALNYMALAGYDAQTSMKMLPNVLNLAAAGGIDLAYASDMVTDTQSALGLSIDETTELVDKMAATSSKTNTSVQQLGEALLTVGGTAKNLSGGTTEAAQALGLLADNGIKGSEGGTALRNVLLGLSSSKFEDTFGALGVSAYDAAGNMRSLKDIFADMNEAMADMTVEEKTEALSSSFNKVDLKSLNALLGTSAERWDEVAEAIENSSGAAQKMADTQLDNLEGDITIFHSALEGAQIALSDSLTPALREFVQFGTQGLGELTSLFKSEEFTSFAQGFADSMTGAAKGAYEFLFGVAAVFDEDGDNIVKPRVEGFFDGLFGGIDSEGFSEAFRGLAAAIGMPFSDGGEAAPAKDFGSAFASGINLMIPAIEAATPVVGGISDALGFFAENAGVILPVVGGLAAAFLVMQGVGAVAGLITAVGGALSFVGVGGTAAGAGLTATAGGETAAGAAAAGSAAQLLMVGAAVLMIGGGVALAAAGLWLMADAAISLAESGGESVAVMFGMVGAVIALGAGAAAGGAMMAAGAPGILAFGAAVLMVGAGIGLASAGMSLLAAQLPAIAAFGGVAAANVMMLGTGLMAMGAGALLAGAGCIVLGAGLSVASAGLLLAAPAMAVAAAGAGALGAALGLMAGAALDVGRGAADMGWGLSAAADAMPRIADNALGAGIGIGQLGDAMASASGNLEAGAGPMREAGEGAQMLGSGVAVAASGAMAAAAAYGAMSVAAAATVSSVTVMTAGISTATVATAAYAGTTMSGMAEASGAAASAGAGMSAFAATALSSMASAAGEAAVAGGQIRSALSGLDFDVWVYFNLGPMPHFRLEGKFDAENGTVPELKVDWYAGGAIFAPNHPGLIGIGDARVPEVAAPIDKLQDMLDYDGGGTTVVNIDGVRMFADDEVFDLFGEFMDTLNRKNGMMAYGR